MSAHQISPRGAALAWERSLCAINRAQTLVGKIGHGPAKIYYTKPAGYQSENHLAGWKNLQPCGKDTKLPSLFFSRALSSCEIAPLTRAANSLLLNLFSGGTRGGYTFISSQVNREQRPGCNKEPRGRLSTKWNMRSQTDTDRFFTWKPKIMLRIFPWQKILKKACFWTFAELHHEKDKNSLPMFLRTKFYNAKKSINFFCMDLRFFTKKISTLAFDLEIWAHEIKDAP